MVQGHFINLTLHRPTQNYFVYGRRRPEGGNKVGKEGIGARLGDLRSGLFNDWRNGNLMKRQVDGMT